MSAKDQDIVSLTMLINANNIEKLIIQTTGCQGRSERETARKVQ